MKRIIIRIKIFLIILLFLTGCMKDTTLEKDILLPAYCNFFLPSPNFEQAVYDKCDDSLWLSTLPHLVDEVPIQVIDNQSRRWLVRAWLPDNTGFILETWKESGDTQIYWLVKINDKTKVPLCELPARERALVPSPEGTAFAVIDRTGTITLVHTNDNDCEILPIPGLVMKTVSISWSPDGQKIAYVSYSEETQDNEIRAIDLNTLQQTTIYNYGGVPEWTPDGKKIVLFGWAGVIPIIWADGSGLIDEVAIPEKYIIKQSGGIAWSPDGSRLALYLKTSGSEREPVAIGILDMQTLSVLVFETPFFSEILGWKPDGEKVVILVHTNEGRVLKEIRVMQ